MPRLPRAAVFAALAGFAVAAAPVFAQQPPPTPFNGITTGVGDLPRLSKAKTRSISPENFTGEKGKGGMATEGTGKTDARTSASAGRSRPPSSSSPARSSRSPTSRAPARSSTSG